MSKLDDILRFPDVLLTATEKQKLKPAIKDLFMELISECDRNSGFDDDVFMIEEAELRQKVSEL